jgi:hypothetical protein
VQVRRLAEDIASIIRGESAFRADFALEFAEEIRNSPEKTWELYTSHAWWGGPGSMADYQFGSSPQNRAYTALLAELVRLFQRAGFDYPRARGWADAFEGWARKGVYG